MVQEPFEARYPGGTTDYAQVKANRHHARGAAALVIKTIECIDAVAREVVGENEPAAVEEAHVVGVERIGQDNMVVPFYRLDIGQIVIVGVGVVEKPPMPDEQVACPDRGGGARVPADWRDTRSRRDRVDRTGNRRAFTLFVHVDMAFPSPAVRRYLMAVLNGFGGQPWRYRQSAAIGVQGRANVPLPEGIPDTRPAGAGAVLE